MKATFEIFVLNYKTKRKLRGLEMTDRESRFSMNVKAISMMDKYGGKYSFDTYLEAENCIESLLTTFPTEVFKIQKVYTNK